MQTVRLHINDWLPINLNNRIELFPLKISDNDTLVITKPEKLHFLLENSSTELNYLKTIIDKIDPLKSLREICVENNFSYSWVKNFAKQIIYWKIGKKFSKINSFTVFAINPDFVPKQMNRAEIMLNFIKLFDGCSDLETLSKKRNMDTLSKEDFVKCVQEAIIKEYLLPCNTIVLPKVKIRFEQSLQKHLLTKLKGILKNNMAEPSAEDISSLSELIKVLKLERSQDGEMLNNLYYYFSEDFNFSEICFLTGYAPVEVNKILKKYKELFYIINIL